MWRYYLTDTRLTDLMAHSPSRVPGAQVAEGVGTDCETKIMSRLQMFLLHRGMGLATSRSKCAAKLDCWMFQPN